jgi:hypothetical protein
VQSLGTLKSRENRKAYRVSNLILKLYIMKTIKQAFTFILVTVIMITSFSINAQDLKENAKMFKIEIPSSMKIDTNDKQPLTVVTGFNKRLNVTVTVSGYVDSNGNVKISSLYSSKSFDPTTKAAGGCPNGYRACARGCTGSPTHGGVLLCTIYCMIDCSGGIQ